MSTKKNKQRGLGRGLSALMADVEPTPTTSADVPAKDPVKAPVERIYPNPDQPRRAFSEEDLNDLAASIAEKGVIQPLIVRAHPNRAESYEIVAGERRWRAAQMAQLHELPIVIREFSDEEVLEVAIIENIQRADLNPMEEALGFRQLMDKFGHTQEKMAEALGKSRSYIANLLRLMQLPTDVQEMLADGRLTTGHARALITTDNPSQLAQIVIKRDLSVRETEKLAKHGLVKTGPKPAQRPEKDADTKALEGDLSANLKMKVALDHAPGGEAGTMTIRYKSLDQLDELCRLLSN